MPNDKGTELHHVTLGHNECDIGYSVWFAQMLRVSYMKAIKI